MKHVDVIKWLEVKNIGGESTLVVDYTNRIEERKRKIVARLQLIRELGKNGGKTLTDIELRTVVACQCEIREFSKEIRSMRGAIERVKGEDAKRQRRETSQESQTELSERTPVDGDQLPNNQRKAV